MFTRLTYVRDWILDSPRRLVIIIVSAFAFITIALLASAAIGRGSSTADTTQGAASPDMVACRDAVSDWAGTFATTNAPHDMWVRAVRQRMTIEGGQQVPFTDLETIPAGKPKETVVEDITGNECAAKVTMANGRPWDVTAMRGRHRWLVNDYIPPLIDLTDSETTPPQGSAVDDRECRTVTRQWVATLVDRGITDSVRGQRLTSLTAPEAVQALSGIDRSTIPAGALGNMTVATEPGSCDNTIKVGGGHVTVHADGRRDGTWKITSWDTQTHG